MMRGCIGGIREVFLTAKEEMIGSCGLNLQHAEAKTMCKISLSKSFQLSPMGLMTMSVNIEAGR